MLLLCYPLIGWKPRSLHKETCPSVLHAVQTLRLRR